MQPSARKCVNRTRGNHHSLARGGRPFQGTMPFNLPATLVPLYALFNPRLILPSVTVVRIMSYPILDAWTISPCSATFGTLTLPPYEMQATAAQYSTKTIA